MSDVERLGETLAPLYHIEHALGRTTAGLALQGMTSDGVACRLMVLPPEIRAAMRDPARFTRELERSGRFAAEGVLHPLGAGVPTKEVAYFGFEDPGAPSARETLERGVILGAPDVARVGASLATTLGRIHSEGLVHGLITPDLIFLPADGTARLAGIGVYSGLAAAGTPTGVIADVLELEHYLSPEQLEGGPIDARSDVFLLGVTLYELLTGRPPFGGRTTSTVMVSVLADEPTRTAPGGVRAPGHTVGAILRAIEKDPADRWPSMQAFGEALLEESLPGHHQLNNATVTRSGCAPAFLLATGIAGLFLLA